MALAAYDTQEIQLVVFRLSGEEYGLPITQVKEIRPLTTITQVPKAPVFVEGVINLRGKVMPVIDLRKRFGIKVQPHDERTRIVVIEVDGNLLGMIVDEVTEVLRLPTSEIDPPSSIFTSFDTNYLYGIGKTADRLLIILKLEGMFAPSEKAEMAAMNANT